jgi:galactokinase
MRCTGLRKGLADKSLALWSNGKCPDLLEQTCLQSEPQMSQSIALDLACKFKRHFGAAPQLFRAPGRVNLIGEHTDYNDGFVLPAALELGTFVAVAARADRVLRICTLAFDASAAFQLDDPSPAPRGDWSDYVRGVAIELERAGHQLRGADLMIGSDLPIGAGLSASAALEVGTGYALLQISGAEINLIELAKYCQRAENNFVGIRCGIMDQFISCLGVEGCALLIDCRSVTAKPIQIDPSARLVICDTMVRHQLASSEYNPRRRDCERAVRLLSDALGGVNALRDVTLEVLEKHAALLPDQILNRARHVVAENARALDAVAALEAGDLAACGQLMNESHASLRDEYEVSCPELDLMVELALDVEGVFGSRMTGAGFGGCTVSLVEAGAVHHFTELVGEAYREATGRTPRIFSSSPQRGVGPVEL